jgi:hypothetical protein
MNGIKSTQNFRLSKIIIIEEASEATEALDQS